jgi:hypothetical protein
MQTGDNVQEPRPEEKDDETPGPETGTPPRGKNWAAHTFTARTTEEPDESDGSEGTRTASPRKIGAKPPR